MRIALQSVLASALAVLALIVPAHAANDIWDGPGSGVWGVGTNWLDNSTPGPGDTATFNSDFGSIYSVTFDADPAPITGLTINNNSTVVFSRPSGGTARTLTVNNGDTSPDLVVDFAILSLGVSPDRSHHLVIGSSIVQGENELTVQNQGTLNVRFGSDVNTAGTSVAGDGQIFVVGAGSSLSTSLFTNGVVNVGGASGSGLLAYSAGASGSLGRVFVGGTSGGSGLLSLDSGSTVTATNVTVGQPANNTNTVSINGSGSTLSVIGVTVGSGAGTGVATLNIGNTASGGTLASNSLTVFTTGVVNVGSATNSGTINTVFVTIFGGDVTVNDGGTFLLASDGTVAVSTAGQSGGLLRFNGDYTTDANTTYTVFGAGSRIELPASELVHNGNLSVSSGGVVEVATMTVNAGGVYTTETPAALLVDDLIINGGTRTFSDGSFGTTIGQSATIQNAAQVSVTGDVAINSVDYTVTGALSSLTVGGDITIDAGTLSVGSGSTFTLAGGRTMTIQNGGSANFTDSYLTAANGVCNITGAGSVLQVAAGNLIIDDGAQVNLTSGGTINVSGSVVVAERGTLNAGSSVNGAVLGQHTGQAGRRQWHGAGHQYDQAHHVDRLH